MGHPHDSLFFAAFGRPEDAAGLLRAALPREAAEAVDWTTLERAADTLKEVGKNAAHADLLFTARFGCAPGTVYFLLEHKSYVDPAVTLQCLRYVVRIQARHRREHPQDPDLPTVLPVVIHHGPRRWNAPVRLADMTRLPPGFREGLDEQLLAFGVLVDDLGIRTDAEIALRAANDRAHLGLRALRDVRVTADVPALFRSVRDFLHRLAATVDGAEFISAFFLYVTQVLDLPGEELRAIIRTELRPPQESHMASTYDQIFGSGVSAGISQGVVRGQIESVLITLRARFGEIPARVERVVGATPPARLADLVARAAVVDRPEDLLTDEGENDPRQKQEP